VSTLTPVLTTVSNLQPYASEVPDTAKAAIAAGKNNTIDGYNNKVRIFNSYLNKTNVLIKQLDQTNADIVKMSQSDDNRYKGYAKNAPGLLNEIVVSNSIVRKE